MPPTRKPRPRNVPRALTERERCFCACYLRLANGTQAAVEAGYSARSAYNQATRLMKKDEVQAEIARLRAEREVRTAITADAVLHELAAEARRHDERASHSARVRALELLGKHLGLFREKLNVEVGGVSSNPVEVTVYIPATDADTGVPDDTELDDADARTVAG